MIRLALRIGAIVIAALIGANLASAVTASNTVPTSRVGNPTEIATANKLKPSDCASLNLTAIVTGSGTITGTTAAELILGSSAADTIDGNGGGDCILGGASNDSLTKGSVCVGGPGNDSFPGTGGNKCGTQIQ